MANIELILTPASPTGSIVFNLGTPGPQGIPGLQGIQGIPGQTGATGQGVPVGGTTSQVLAKINGTDFNTQWVNQPSLAGYATEAWVTSQSYITIAALTPYLTSALASSTYYPLTNPTGFITISALTPYLTSALAATTYAPIASAVPVGGSTGQVLTKTSGTNYAANWQTPVVGDRYLTTSVTSNTIGNGNKTFTIGTGLSYTPTQNLTISYNAANHMHGEVLTYNSGTGVLTVDIKNHTGSGTYTAWVVNVGGVTPATSVAWGAITGTLSTQTDLQTALDAKISDAPSDGTPYVRLDGAWEQLIIT